MDSKFVKALVLGFVILYVVSPLDFCPGPIDDFIAVILGFAARKNLSAN